MLAALVGLQLVTGLSNVVFNWPLLAALLHTGGAAALVLTLTWIGGRAIVVPQKSVSATATRATRAGSSPEPGSLT